MTLGSKIINTEILTSTNITAVSLASSHKVPEGTVVMTDFQTGGKGQPGNTWESEPGKNLLLSLILYPEELQPQDQFFVSMAVSLGLCNYLTTLVDHCRIKWPNDIYVSNDKIAGILIESSIIGNKFDYMVAGIGLNVNQEKFQTGKNPTSLKILTGKTLAREEVLSGLLESVNAMYELLRTKQNLKLRTEYLRTEYLGHLYRYNEWAEFQSNKTFFIGRITDVENDGTLVIETKENETRRFHFKEIEFILPDPSN